VLSPGDTNKHRRREGNFQYLRTLRGKKEKTLKSRKLSILIAKKDKIEECKEFRRDVNVY